MNTSSISKSFSIISVGIFFTIMLLAYAGAAHAAGPWYVSAASGNDANDCLTVLTACKTIQAAINKASPGDTVNVAAGIYAEHVTIDKALTLNGANNAVACRAARSTESVIIGSASGAVQILADNVVFNGFQVSSTNNALNSGIWMDATKTGAIIKNNLISQNQIGIYANNAGASSITCNIFDGNNETGPSGSTGIYSEFTSALTIDSNEFKNHLQNSAVLFGATAAGVHTSLVFSGNLMHDNVFANILALGVDGGTFSGNTITPASDSTGITFDGADSNISVTKNVIKNGARAVRVRDAGYGLGANSAITVNRNDVSLNTDFGIGNDTGTLDGTCNWWGAADGPGGVGTGSGSPVTTNVTFSPWLTTSDLTNDPCTGGAPASDVTVTIVKNISGVHATTANANSATFPMQACWSATNIGAGCGNFGLGPVGFNNPNPYEATTADMTSGADYSTNEDTSTAVVGPNCASGQQFHILGYTTGDTLLSAQGGAVSSTSPAFTSITSNKWVVVWNEPCAVTPAPTPPPPANACATPTVAPAGYTILNGSGGNETVAITPSTMFVGHGGNDKVTGGDGNYIVCTGGGNDVITLGNGDYTVDAGAGQNIVKTGNGNGAISSGSGNDSITVLDGAHTIAAGSGNNVIKTGNGDQDITAGSGNDSITTGSGADTISAGSGNNVIKSGAGADTVTTGSGNDSIDGGPDTDSCSAGAGTNLVTNCP